MEIIHEFKKSNKKYKDLFYGIEISVKDFIKFVGGQSSFKKGLKHMKNWIIEEIKKSKKQGYEIGSVLEKIEYPDYATISFPDKQYSLNVSYAIWGYDKTGHQMAIGWTVKMKKDEEYISQNSGWDG